jgi:hypothetical protein
MATVLTVVDDSGLLGLVDAAAYRPFVDPEWTFETLVAHFKRAMAQRQLAVWDCGDGGNDYRIEIREKITAERGFREAIGAIEATEGRLYLVSYTALTMAAQFDAYAIPAESEADLWIAVPKGPLRVRVVQTYDPANDDGPGERRPHLIVEIEPGVAPAWAGVAWNADAA